MMPRWVCKGCSKQFRGWAMYHRYKNCELLQCPECNGELELLSDTKAAKQIIDIISEQGSASDSGVSETESAVTRTDRNGKE